MERPRDLQLRRIAGESLLRLDLQKTVRIFRGELRHEGVLAHDPTRRERDHTLALANPGGIEVILDLSAHELGVRMQDIQREGGGSGLHHFVDALGASDVASPHVAVGEGEADDRG